MSIAIIISTHGSSAEQLLKTAEMILGKQKNVAWIDFLNGENTDILIKKYNTKLENMDTTNGVLFLVDTWGGSPFNAASKIVMNINNNNYEVISGVNIPMITEIFMARDDNPSFQELVKIAVYTGRFGVKSLKANLSYDEDTLTKHTHTVPVKNHQANHNNHMIIVLARIDDRLIHGQVVTRWTKDTKVKRIIVINDEVANDVIRKTILTQVAPPGITAHVVDIAKAIRVYDNPKYANDLVMLLFTNPSDVLRIIEGGVNITKINIGGMAFCKGKHQINNAVSVDDTDIAAFKQLNKLGIELEVRQVPSDSPLNMMNLIKNKLGK
ncbi:PTS system, mannose-specific IIA component / PTS system, mannose-specific IIB component [Candidatus Palibaumannia cicadellinicola]|uniref:PTS system mannose-specific EIIAB component n=1 Tax=Candidatus Palibaumannia cicadellinicola TaxID=186490 RepID=A0A0K2BKS2_9GAMM|nr:PTS mannose transporter subunit IIAB [Candidatus Baumannia cicadellinicola]AKZ65991.1 PTS system, mannose-specific IIA component / PTS system, mannose-specific IIB component [Candidatus Baumannia cicadellinicola]